MRNGKTIIATATAELGMAPEGFDLEEDRGFLVVKHQDTMRWSAERRAQVAGAFSKASGKRATVV